MKIEDVLEVLRYPRHIVSRVARRAAFRDFAKAMWYADLHFFDFIKLWWFYRFYHRRALARHEKMPTGKHPTA